MTTDPEPASDAITRGFLADGGEMGARLRGMDWSGHALGEPEGWPEQLRLAVALMLRSAFPTALYWGPELRLLYNDAWSVIPGERHPWALGRPGAEVWPDIWDTVGPQMHAALLSGQGFNTFDQMLPMHRDGAPRETYWNYSFTPVVDGTGRVLGLLNQGQETTALVLQRRDRRNELERMRDLFEQAPAAIAVVVGPTHRFVIANPAYDRLIGHRQLLERTVADALPEVVGQGFVALLDGVRRSGVAHRSNAAPVDLETEPGIVTTRMVDFVFQPIKDASGACYAIFIEATDVTDRWAAEAEIAQVQSDRDFLFDLGERLRALSDPDDITTIAVEALGARLQVGRIGFLKVDGDRARVDFRACYVNGPLPLLEGHAGFAALSATTRRALDAEDSWFIDGPGGIAAGCDTAGVAAMVVVPLRRLTMLEGGFYAHHPVPRAWTVRERQLIEDVAQVSWDAKQRARAGLLLREANAELQQMVRARTAERDRIWEVSRDLLGVASEDGVWLAVNPAWQRVLGWSEAEIVGRTSEWLEHPDDRLDTRSEIESLGTEEAVTEDFVNRFRGTDGRYRTLSWTAVAVEGLLYCVARDVTEVKEREAALARAEQRTRLALAAVNGVGTYTYEPDRDRLLCDAAFAAMFGLPPNAAGEGWALAEVLRAVADEDRTQVQANIAVATTTEGDSRREYRLNRGDGGPAWVMTRSHTARGEDGRLLITGVAVDTTEQHRLEDALRQAQKMEAVGQLTGGLAHDFNNMLMGISGALEMMRRRVEQGREGELPRYLDAAQGATRRAAALTHRLLAFARRQTLDPRATDVQALVRGMEEIVRRAVGPGIAIALDVDDAGATVLVDPNQLENALLNLCINARDAMTGEGKLTIAVARSTIDPAQAEDLGIVAGPFVALDVIDNGAGMSATVQDRVFDPFFTTKPIGEGTGLGLSMVYGFVRQSGGAIRIESAEGEGTTMRLLLPRFAGAVDEARTGGGGPVAGATCAQRVLVVDDEATVRMLVVDTLSEKGYLCSEAEDGPQAVALVEGGAALDLLVSDIGLPGGMNGREVADALRMRLPALKTLFITGFAEQSVLGDGRLAPGTAVLTKPFAIDALAERVAMLAADD